MDEFGVLVESIGFKAQGRSAPMAKLKSQPKPNSFANGFPQTVAPSKPLNNNNNDPFFVDDLDGIFRSSNSSKNSQNSHDFFGVNDVFGGPFSNSKPSGAGGGVGLDDLLGGNSSSKGSSSLYDDLLSGSSSKNEDIFGLNSNNANVKLAKNGSGFDDLIPGFGQSNNGANSATGRGPQENPLSVFESFASHHEKSGGKSSSSIDELENFAMGRSESNANEQSHVKISKEAITKVQEKLRNMKDLGEKQNEKYGNIKISFQRKDGRDSKVASGTSNHSQTGKNKAREQKVTSKDQNTFKKVDNLDAIFSNDHRRPRSTNEDPMLDALFNGKGETKVEKTSSLASQSTKKAPSSSCQTDDFSFLFGEPALSAVEFQEIDGEPEERRRARFNNHMRTKERMAKALQEKNQRDLEVQFEQEEKCRLSETLDADIKRWAAGKEGNLRALLSALQYVLWPECGWQPVSLTDLITSVSVKKVYHKATLCVHPDKVQQKGANVQQKYIAEKVFDLLKEAWNKFNMEELR